MLSALAVSGYVFPPPPLTVEGGSRQGIPTGDTVAKLASLAETLANARIKLREQRDRFDLLYGEAEQPVVSPDDLESLAQVLHLREQEHAEILVPQIERLRKNLASPKGQANTPKIRSWRRLAEESLEIAISWLELYQNLQIRLLKLASDRQRDTHPGSPIFSDAESATAHLRKLLTE